MLGWKCNRVINFLPCVCVCVPGCRMLRDLVGSGWKPARRVLHFRCYFIIPWLILWPGRRLNPSFSIRALCAARAEIVYASNCNGTFSPLTIFRSLRCAFARQQRSRSRSVSRQITMYRIFTKKINASSWLWIYKTLYFVALSCINRSIGSFRV